MVTRATAQGGLGCAVPGNLGRKFALDGLKVSLALVLRGLPGLHLGQRLAPVAQAAAFGLPGGQLPGLPGDAGAVLVAGLLQFATVGGIVVGLVEVELVASVVLGVELRDHGLDVGDQGGVRARGASRQRVALGLAAPIAQALQQARDGRFRVRAAPEQVGKCVGGAFANRQQDRVMAQLQAQLKTELVEVFAPVDLGVDLQFLS